MSKFFDTPIINVASTSEMLVIQHTDSIDEALKKLKEGKVLSAPVSYQQEKQVYSSIDVLDLLTFILSVRRNSSFWVEDIRNQYKLPVVNAIDFSEKNPFLPVLDENPIRFAIRDFFCEGVHRLPVVSFDQKLKAVLSQWDVLSFIYKGMKEKKDVELVKLGEKSLFELGLVPSQVLSISQSDPLLCAFNTIRAYKVSGVAIRNDKGELVGNVSASDFGGFVEDQFFELDTPASEFCQREIITCKPENALKDVVEKMITNKIHRVYIVDDFKQPVGVVSLTDCCKIVNREILIPQEQMPMESF